MSEDKVLRKTSQTVLEKKTRESRYFHNEGLHNFYYVIRIIVAVKSKRARFLGHVF
jgi:hypothetical protein